MNIVHYAILFSWKEVAMYQMLTGTKTQTLGQLKTFGQSMTALDGIKAVATSILPVLNAKWSSQPFETPLKIRWFRAPLFGAALVHGCSSCVWLSKRKLVSWNWWRAIRLDSSLRVLQLTADGSADRPFGCFRQLLSDRRFEDKSLVKNPSIYKSDNECLIVIRFITYFFGWEKAVFRN